MNQYIGLKTPPPTEISAFSPYKGATQNAVVEYATGYVQNHRIYDLHSRTTSVRAYTHVGSYYGVP